MNELLSRVDVLANKFADGLQGKLNTFSKKADAGIYFIAKNLVKVGDAIVDYRYTEGSLPITEEFLAFVARGMSHLVRKFPYSFDDGTVPGLATTLILAPILLPMAVVADVANSGKGKVKVGV